ncbi:unnamed protein product [Lymnaea stagnalis]|uniref:Neurogenic mastermind-like N-terminal domain-containing protein n=1 Tax=Lymnaea stagnalis TaxID=6523 RepID=A0AAV2I394_LYMST
MGDFFAPRRKDVVDKLRRRLELYRQHHSISGSRYLSSRPNIIEHQKQETLQLRQRWLDSKAKKAAKQSKASRDTNNTQSDHRNLVVNKLKRKIDPSVSTDANTASVAASATTTAAETIFNFGEKDHHPSHNKNSKISNGATGGGGGGGGTSKHNPLPSLSVQIVQQISANPQQDTSQTIHTNVTVSSRYSNSDSPNPGGTSHSVLTSVQCKQEPSDDSVRTSTSNNNTPSTVHTSHIDHSSVGDLSFGDIDEIQDILDSIEKDEDIAPDLRRDLEEFKEIYEKVQRDSESHESNMYGSLTCVSPGLSKGVYPSHLGPGGSLSTMFDSNQNMSAAAMTNPNTIPVPAAIPEPTGPAAETLKQMAAQHQHQHSPGYPMKGMDHFSNGGFPPNYSQLYRSVPNTPSPFPYNHTANHHLGDASQMNPEIGATMVYGSTKPLTHYSNEQGQHNSPSSLQQLQNQVQSHFKPSAASPHQMQIIQSQQLQVSHGPHSMQLSQSQQVQMQPSAQISMSQHQNFSMQMMEKMRMEQQQARMPPQYMKRPPPEYNMHPNARPQGTYPTAAAGTGNPNPLQTMQNMVNQTSAYSTVKSEVPGTTSTGQSVNGMMQSTQMQQQSMSASMATNGGHMGSLPQASQGIASGFHAQQQQMQQPPAYSTVDSASRAPSSTYTSAIMRNQRPPNVNVGPDGLNISQPRTHSEWPRPSMMPNQHAGMRPGMQTSGHGMAQSSAMSAAHMMQYQRPPHYGASTQTGGMTAAAAAAAATSMAQMQQQQQVRTAIPGQINRGGQSMMPNGGQIMLQQHQSMQVTQQMNMHGSSPGYSMGGPSPGATNTGYNMGGPSPGATNTGYNMGGPSPGATNTGYSMGGPSPGATANQNTGYNMGGPSPGATATSTGYNISGQQTSVSQTAGFPAPSTPNRDEFLNFLDPLGSQPMFDSLHSSTPDDFSLFEDILNGK